MGDVGLRAFVYRTSSLGFKLMVQVLGVVKLYFRLYCLGSSGLTTVRHRSTKSSTEC